MNTQEQVRPWTAARVGFLGLLLGVWAAWANSAEFPDQHGHGPVVFTGAVPKAHCGPRDRPEGGLQGQTTPAERASGDSQNGYNCNLELVSQFRGEGAVSQNGPTYFDECAYFATNNNPLQQHRGVVVLDVSDTSRPLLSEYLDDTLAMANPHETLRANAPRKLLAAAQNNGPDFAVYDLSADCRTPALKGEIQLTGSQAHMGNFAPDGRTYYVGQNNRGIGGFLYVVDLDDVAHPKELPPWQFLGDGRPHGIWLNAAGTRLYAGQPGLFGNTGSSIGPDGLVIDDVSDYQFRRPNPQIRIVSKLFWQDQGQVEDMLPFSMHGRHYVVSTDESGGAGGAGGLAGAGQRGASPYGYPNIIDITDETNPRIVSKLMLEVSEPANCNALLNDPPDVGAGAPAYNEERCAVNRMDNPTMLACAFQNAGLRVFDIRNLSRPKEIAYYKPPAPRTAVLPGSGSWAPGVDLTVDRIAGYPRFHTVVRERGKGRGRDDERRERDRGESQLWTVSDGNGFQVLRFTDHFKAEHRDLFEDSAED
jgi:hypothetical protein